MRLRRLSSLVFVTYVFPALSWFASAAEPGREVASKDPDFRLPPGFIVQKVAGPPLVRYPLFASLDDRGRLYVAEGTGTNLPGTELAGKKLGRILRLEDVDGDGTAVDTQLSQR